MLKLIQILWLFLPAALANMSPVIFKKIPFLDYPVDHHLKYKNKRILGNHKTWRGFFFGTLIAVLIVFLQSLLYPKTQSITLINYSEINIFLLGFLLGFGALFGDSLKSFFKRQINIAPGKPWIPFDQIDWIFGASILVSFYINLSIINIIIAIILLGSLHPLVNLISYASKIQKNKF
ncbi:CDP-archaeol synthase [bacterium]|nr:CDP-archaeol synthase [bacterium]